MEELNKNLARAMVLLDNFVRGELPDAENLCTPETVTLIVSHIDHEDYRHWVRMAKTFNRPE
jgi:hypothetical protein